MSMIGSEYLWDINHRQKQIIGNHKYFSGLNVIATGDFHQQAPIIWLQISEKFYLK